MSRSLSLVMDAVEDEVVLADAPPPLEKVLMLFCILAAWLRMLANGSVREDDIDIVSVMNVLVSDKASWRDWSLLFVPGNSFVLIEFS